jgi:eukaryotic-like serine/threonine-protein kinase
MKPLGKGGMADLYLAKDRLLGRKVVIKVLSSLLMQKKDFHTRFIREARIQSRLDNPYIVQIFGFMVWEGTPCLVMQHVRGTDLEKVIKTARTLKERNGGRGALSVERAVHIFAQVLEGIGFAHKYRIIHGDIKPSNILLDRQGRAKVADFGLAKFTLRENTQRGTGPFQAGSPHYMSPEQIFNLEVDLRSDIYSLGVTLFHMITGKFPHGEKRSATDLVEWHMEGSLEEAREILAESGEIPVRVRHAILSALDNEPDQRPQSCLEFALAVREETTQEMFSELLRMSLLTKRQISASERAYLDRFARKRSLSLDQAQALEANIRKEIGLAPVDFAAEYRDGMESGFRQGEKSGSIHNRLDALYVETRRLSEAQAREIKNEPRDL